MGGGGYEGDEKGGDYSGRGGGGGGGSKPPAGFKVFVGGIPFKWDDQDLRDFFMKLGNVVHAKVSCSCRRLHAVPHLPAACSSIGLHPRTRALKAQVCNHLRLADLLTRGMLRLTG